MEKKAALTVVASTGRLIVTEERWSRRPRGKVITYIEDNTKKQEVITNTGDNIEMIQKKQKKTGGARGQGAKLSHIEGIIQHTGDDIKMIQKNQQQKTGGARGAIFQFPRD